MTRLSKRAVARLVAGISTTVVLGSFSEVSYGQTSPSNYTSAIRYDQVGRVVGAIAPDPDGSGPLHYPAVRNTYDIGGRLTLVETGELSGWFSEQVAPSVWPGPSSSPGFTVYRTVAMTYDTLGRKLTERVKGADLNTVSLTQFSYDTAGRLDCTAVRMNPAVYGALPASACTLGAAGNQGADRITKNEYDAAGQLLQVRKAVGVSGLEQAYVTYTYTANGKQEYVIDANGNRAKLEYDGFDRQRKWIFPSASGPSAYNPATPAAALTAAGSVNSADYEEYGYDANGNRTSFRKRDGSLITYTFDALNRNSVKTVPQRSNLPGAYARSVYYSYDARSLMTAARFESTAGEGVTTIYDGLGRITSSTVAMDGVSRTVSSLSDANGNRTQVTHPDSAFFDYLYDGLDRPTLVREGTTNALRSYLYNPAGLPSTDTAGGGSAGVTTYGYDPVGRINSIFRNQAGSTVDVTTTFTYTPASQLKTEARDNDAYAYTARINGSRTYMPNGLNQYASINSAAYCHDANGNLTFDGTNVYLYDIENRLVESRAKVNTTCTSLDYSGTVNAKLRYDPMGRLYETDGPVTGTTRYLIDGDNLIGEYSSAGTLLRRYVHGADSRADDPVAWYEGTATNGASLRLLFADRQGSITLTGDSSGNPVRLFKYDEYGIPQAGDGAPRMPTNGARFMYTGQAWIPDLGMYYYKARIYAPMIGRFMQTDPIGYKDQVNLYAYVGNDPVNGSDPEGLARVDDAVASDAESSAIKCQGTPGCENIFVAGGNQANNTKSSASPQNGTVRSDWIDDPGLETDEITTTLATLGAGIISSTVRSGLERFGLKLAMDGASSSRSSLVSRLVSTNGSLRFSATVAAQSGRNIPSHAILQTIAHGRRAPDPQGVAGQFMYTLGASRFMAATATRDAYWSRGALEVLVHEGVNQIRHVLYRSSR